MQKLNEIEKMVIRNFGLTLEKLKKEDYPSLSEVATFCMCNGYLMVYDKISALAFLKNIEEKLDIKPLSH